MSILKFSPFYPHYMFPVSYLTTIYFLPSYFSYPNSGQLYLTYSLYFVSLLIILTYISPSLIWNDTEHNTNTGTQGAPFHLKLPPWTLLILSSIALMSNLSWVMSALYLLFWGAFLSWSVCSLRSLFLRSNILLKVFRMNSAWSGSLLSSISLDSCMSATISISTCSWSGSSRHGYPT